MADWMLELYTAIPEWLVAVALMIAGWTYVLAFRWQSRRGVIDYMPPLSLGAALGLFTLALVYVWLAFDPDMALPIRGGAVRLALLILSVALALNNGGAVRMSWREWRARRKARRR